MERPYQPLEDIAVLPTHFPIPGAGYLAVNAFVIKAKEPVLVDTGLGIDGEAFIRALKSVIDPKELKWIWITHDDADHTGNLQRVLEEAPNAKLVAYSLAVLRMSTIRPMPMERIHWLNPGDTITAGDRKLTAVRPPVFDNPTTIGLYDDRSEALFSADCFGAIISTPAIDADAFESEELCKSMAAWASLDNPWIHMVKPSGFNLALNSIRRISPKVIFSAHLPVARGKTEGFLDMLAKVPIAPPSMAPNQMALEKIRASMIIMPP
jgi:glyoxylase-like metal-dependent hydrolase (beta-lactamase superfamily II)